MKSPTFPPRQLRLSRTRQPTLLGAVVAVLGAATLGVVAGTHTWSGAVNDQWNLPENWSSGGVPTPNESAPVILIFPSSTEARSATRNNIPGLTVDRLTLQRGGYRFSATGSTLRFRGTGEKIWIASSLVSATNVFDSSFGLFLLDDAELEVGTRQTLTILSRISGPGGLIKTGSGAVELAGTQANTYMGPTTVQAGQLRLGKSDGVLAVPGDLSIGAGTAANEDVVRLLASHQLNDSKQIAVGPSGWLDLNGRTETVGNLLLTGGRVSSGAGTLTLAGNVTTQPSGRTAIIQGRLSLGGGNRTFNTALGSAPSTDLHVQAVVSGSGLYSGLRKGGPGRLELSGANTYAGPTTIEAGWLTVVHPTALGVADSTSLVPSGTTVHPEATLSIVGVGLGDEDLALSGHGADGFGALVTQGAQPFGCRIGLLADASIRVGNLPSSTLTLTRFVQGPGKLIKTGPGTLRFTGSEPNTHTGGTEIREGAIVSAKPAGVVSLPGLVVVGDGLSSDPDVLGLETAGQLSPDAILRLENSGQCTIPAGRHEIIGTIEGTGRLILEGRLSLNVPPGDWFFGGWTTGTGELRKSGTGTLVLGGSLRHALTRVTGGTLRLNSPVNESRFVIDGGTFVGQGQTGRIESQAGRLGPGVGSSGTGVFSTGNLRFSPATTLRFDLNGLTGNSQHDQWATIGTVDLGGAHLDLQFGFVPPAGSKFLLFLNDGSDPITGRFAGLPEGAQFQVAGLPLRITYQGGSSANDVILEVVGTPATARTNTATVVENGVFRHRTLVAPNQTFHIERSADLIHWHHIGTAVSGEDGQLDFADAEATMPTAFYRLTEQESSKP
ncbi:MAG: autotransporter-associated beta strand repeat-containing protein [Verrucomicrobiales bacterium]|nr:autotransporter-associated beta strand repeat-containing protein [Verrucomicrobiales bacterium]